MATTTAIMAGVEMAAPPARNDLTTVPAGGPPAGSVLVRQANLYRRGPSGYGRWFNAARIDAVMRR
ncbi:hypothetical protein, partial [Mesorhizobium sp. M7A.F.Ca.CA.001.08.1.1]|uniref:hypothetical protein n=1 Tax=Mesorhizobium sp. M7A.F.Ca.CA.001.08.1.1 TaxID=2496691 RepID=UPI0019D2F24B